MQVSPSIETLLSEDLWIRRLARRLVSNPSEADDLAQDAWVAALERPAAASHRRRWLAGVVRNLSREGRRREGRRVAREESVARPEALPSTAEVVEEMTLRREVADALLELDEPWRRVLFLRFFRDMSLKEIGRETGVATSTAHDQLGRGLALLRERLDRQHGGDRKQWMLALTPLARLEIPGVPIVTATATPSSAALLPATIGGIAMGSIFKVVLAVAVVTGGVASFSALRQDPETATPSRRAALAANTPAAQLIEAPAPDAPQLEPTRSAVSVPQRTANEPSPAPEGETNPVAIEQRGRVIDLNSAPVPSIDVCVEGAEEILARSDNSGEFVVQLSTDKTHRLSVCDSHYTSVLRAKSLASLSAAAALAQAQNESESASLVLVVAPRDYYAGTTTDPSGRPLAGVEVEISLGRDGYRRLGLSATLNNDAHVLTTTSDADGRFEFQDAPSGVSMMLFARRPGFELLRRELPLVGDSEMALVLEPTPNEETLRGVVLRPTGAVAERAQVTVGNDNIFVTTEPDGSFEIVVSTESPEIEIVAVESGYLPARTTLSTAELDQSIELFLGDSPLEIEARVEDSEGTPLPGVTVWIADLTPFGMDVVAQGEARATINLSFEELLGAGRGAARTESDSNGRLVVEGLLPKEYSLSALDRTTMLTGGPWKVEAGSKGVVLVMEAKPLKRVAGRVLSLTGEPVVGAQLTPVRTPDGLWNWSRVSEGVSSTTTAEDGSFEFLELVPEGTSLRLSADRIPLLSDVPLSRYDQFDDILVEVSLLCDLQVDLSGNPDFADRMRVLDSDGSPCRLTENFGVFVGFLEDVEIKGGRSSVVGADQRARTLVLYREDVEVWRKRIDLDPTELTVVAP